MSYSKPTDDEGEPLREFKVGQTVRIPSGGDDGEVWTARVVSTFGWGVEVKWLTGEFEGVQMMLGEAQLRDADIMSQLGDLVRDLLEPEEDDD